MGQINDDEYSNMINSNIPGLHINDMRERYVNFNPMNVGFIEYEKQHPSIVFQSSMKSLESIQSVGAGSGISAGSVIDSLGTIPGLDGGPVFSGYVTPVGLDTEGQLSFRVDTNAIAENVPSVGTEGFPYTDTTYILSFAAAISGGAFGRAWMDSANEGHFELVTTDSHVTTNMHEYLNGLTTLVTVSWTATTIYIYFNYRLHATGTRLTVEANVFDNIWPGTQRGLSDTATRRNMVNAHFSDFVLASSPVVLTPHALTAQITVWGDSFVGQGTLPGRANYYRNNAEDMLKGYLAEKGISANTTFIGRSGATLNNQSATNIGQDLAAVLATNPTIVILQAGTNDALNEVFDPLFESDLDGHVASIFAGTAQYMILGNASTFKWDSAVDTPIRIANVQTVKTIMSETRLRTSNPIRNYSLYDIYGGEDNPPNTFEGQVTGLVDGFHPSAGGQAAWGRAMGAKVYSILIE